MSTRWEDLTQIELSSFLTKWRGHRAMVWDYTPTLRRLALRLYAHPPETVSGFLVCVGCRRVESEVDWSDAEITIVRDNGHAHLRDRDRMHIICDDVVAVESEVLLDL